MPFISNATLTKVSNIANKALIDDCIIERNSLSNGELSSLVTETVKCLAKPTTDGASFVQSGYVEGYVGNLMLWRVKFPRGTNPQENDVLTIKGQRMTVQRVMKPKTYAVFDVVEASGVRA